MTPKRYLPIWLALLIALCMWLPIVSRAHDPGLSTGTLRVDAERVSAELVFARLDIETIVPIDADRDGKVSPEEWELAKPKLEPLVREALKVRVNDVAIVIADPRFHMDENNNFHLVGNFPARGAKALVVHSTLIERLPRGHRQFVSLLDDKGTTLAEVLLSAQQDVIDVDVSKLLEDDKPAAQAPTFREFFVMGVEHILTGYDHLLFLFGLLIVMSRFRSTVWVITCFTLAHSTTLALAAFDVVRVSGRMVEPLIAATIIYVGAENLLRPEGPRRRWLLTLIFGLVHGLGFATDLKERMSGLKGAAVAVPLISFNLGVELGQMTVAALALPLIWWLRTKPVFVKRWVPACSVAIVLAGGWWLLQRTVM